MDLIDFCGKPAGYVEFADRRFGFGELTLERLATLQVYLDRLSPHPVEEVKPLLEGLAPDERRLLLDDARERAKDWKRLRVETAAGIKALLSERGGQTELFVAAIGLHHPEIDRATAERIFMRAATTGRIEAINDVFAYALGMDPNALESSNEGKLPKAASPKGTFAGT